MTRTKEDTLSQPLDRLEKALAADVPGRERDWAEAVSAALTGMEQALRQHAALAEDSDGLLAEVDLTRPTFARQVGELYREHREFLKQSGQLRAELQNVAQAFQPGPLAGRSPEPTGSAGVADFGALREHGQHFVAALRHHKEEETKLVFESIDTDIGVGD